MAQYIDDNGVAWDVVGYNKPSDEDCFVAKCDSNAVDQNGGWSGVVGVRLIVRPVKRYISTAEEAKAWAQANPDTLVDFTSPSSPSTGIHRASYFVYGGRLDYYKVQVELGKFIPITEIECV